MSFRPFGLSRRSSYELITTHYSGLPLMWIARPLEHYIRHRRGKPSITFRFKPVRIIKLTVLRYLILHFSQGVWHDRPNNRLYFRPLCLQYPQDNIPTKIDFASGRPNEECRCRPILDACANSRRRQLRLEDSLAQLVAPIAGTPVNTPISAGDCRTMPSTCSGWVARNFLNLDLRNLIGPLPLHGAD